MASFFQTISVLLLNSISLAPRTRSNLTGFIRLSSLPILPGKILTVHGTVVVVLVGGGVVVVVDVDCVEVVVKGMVVVVSAVVVVLGRVVVVDGSVVVVIGSVVVVG